MPSPGDRAPLDPEQAKRLLEMLPVAGEAPAPESLRPLTPEEERMAEELLNPDGTMSRPMALVLVQHFQIEFLRDRAAEWRSAAENLAADSVERADAALCAEMAEVQAEALEAANNAVLAAAHAERARVQVVPASAPIKVPGTVLPGGRR